MVLSRIPQMHLREVHQFLPSVSEGNENVGVNDFVSFVKVLLRDRVQQRRDHLDRLQCLRRASYSNVEVRPPSVPPPIEPSQEDEISLSDSDDSIPPPAMPNLSQAFSSSSSRCRTAGGIVNPRPVIQPRLLRVLGNFINTSEGQSYAVSIFNLMLDLMDMRIVWCMVLGLGGLIPRLILGLIKQVVFYPDTEGALGISSGGSSNVQNRWPGGCMRVEGIRMIPLEKGRKRMSLYFVPLFFIILISSSQEIHR